MASHVTLALVAALYLALLFAIGLWSRRQVRSAEDFLVAGRRLPLSLSAATLFATWFGAGTLLTVSDEVRAQGLVATALDPLGAGLCLILAGLWLARPLWDMKLRTLADFYRRRYGRRAERVAALILIPGYFGWIAAQFVALAHLLELTVGLPLASALFIAAGAAALYTLVGGMWSVTATDALQVVLLLFGLGVLFFEVFGRLGSGSVLQGLAALWADTPVERRTLVPTQDGPRFIAWLGVVLVGALGNLPGQDLAQRIFTARDGRTAARACHLAGLGYLTIGFVPALIALAAAMLVPGPERRATLPLLASLLLSPLGAAVFVVTVLSAVLSTVTAAILAPASVLAENLLPERLRARLGELPALRLSVLVVAAASLGAAFLGESAFGLLESAYEIGMVGLLVPLVLGLHGRRGGARAAISSMVGGTALWLLHRALGFSWFLQPGRETVAVPMPATLGAMLVAVSIYFAVARWGEPRRGGDGAHTRAESAMEPKETHR